MIGAILFCIFAVLIHCSWLWYQLRSTPTPAEPPAPRINWCEVRAMEQAIYGTHFHRANGSTKDGGFTSVGEELPSEAQPGDGWGDLGNHMISLGYPINDVIEHLTDRGIFG